jgi:hypothetical protein
VAEDPRRRRGLAPGGVAILSETILKRVLRREAGPKGG